MNEKLELGFSLDSEENITNELIQLKNEINSWTWEKNELRQLRELIDEWEERVVNFVNKNLSAVKINWKTVSVVKTDWLNYKFYDSNNNEIVDLSREKSELKDFNIIWTDWIKLYKFKVISDDKISIVDKNAVTISKKINPELDSGKIVLATIDDYDKSKSYNISQIRIKNKSWDDVSNSWSVEIDYDTWNIVFVSKWKEYNWEINLKLNIIPSFWWIPLYDQEFNITV